MLKKGRRKKVVLLIDDKLEVIQTLRQLLQDNFSVIEVYDIKEAIDILNNLTNFPCINVIVTDDDMPYMRGAYLIRALGVSPWRYYIPTILYTQKEYGVITMTLENGCRKWMHPKFQSAEKGKISIVADKVYELCSIYN